MVMNLYNSKIQSFDDLLGEKKSNEEAQKQQEAEAKKADADTEIQMDPTQPYGGLMAPEISKRNKTEFEQSQKAMMNAQMIGNFLQLLGEGAGLAAGANISPRQSKPLEPYINAIFNRREAIRREEKQDERQRFLDELMFAKEKTRKQERQEEIDFRERKRGEDVEFRDRRQTADEEYKKFLVENKMQD